MIASSKHKERAVPCSNMFPHLFCCKVKDGEWWAAATDQDALEIAKIATNYCPDCFKKESQRIAVLAGDYFFRNRAFHTEHKPYHPPKRQKTKFGRPSDNYDQTSDSEHDAEQDQHELENPFSDNPFADNPFADKSYDVMVNNFFAQLSNEYDPNHAALEDTEIPNFEEDEGSLDVNAAPVSFQVNAAPVSFELNAAPVSFVVNAVPVS